MLTEAGLAAGIGAAPNGEAALMLARNGRPMVCAGRQDVAAKLAPLPVSLLPCEAKVQAVLVRWGIRTLGELAALPRTALVSRLGQEGYRLQQLARGEADHLLVPEEPEFTLTETTALDVAVEMLDSLLFVVSPMLDAVLRKANEYAHALRVVRLTLHLERGGPHRIAIRPAIPTQSREVLLKLLHLELQARPPRASILTVTLDAEPATPQTAQRGLFQAQFPDPSRLDLLLARLRSIAGHDNVGSPVLDNTHREDAFRMTPFQPRPRGSTHPRDPLPSRLAIRVCRPPQPVRVLCEEGQPRTLLRQGSRLAVTLAAGPWHTSGSWWDGEAWDSDLWDVVTAAPAQALRLRQDHASQAWSVVGLYD